MEWIWSIMRKWKGNTGGNSDKNYHFDMIQFIPATENQVWPMLDMKGNQIEEKSPGIEDIWPYK